MISLNYYVDLIRNGRQFTLLAGPFVSEEAARKYERQAFRAAVNDDQRCAFDTYGVVAISDFQLPGLFNAQLAIEPGDLIAA